MTPPCQEGEDDRSPSNLETEVPEDLAAYHVTPTLLDIAEEATKENPEKKTPTACEAYESRKEKSSPSAKKRKSDSIPTSAKTPASSSRTESSPKPLEKEPEKETSYAESSSKKASSEEEGEQTEPPPKKPKVQTRSSKRVKKAQITKGKSQLKEEKVQCELTVPKAIEEFFDHLEVESDKKGEPKNIYFRLDGINRASSINAFNMQLGMVSLLDLSSIDYLTAEKQIPTKMNWNRAWKKLAKEEEFIPYMSKTHSLKSPAMRMCHRILSYNFYGKTDNSNTVSKPELFLLWAIHNQRKVNFAAMVAQLFKQITSREQRLCLCNFPGVFAKNQKLLNFDRPMAVEKLDSFNLQTLQKIFRVQPHGK